MQSTAATRAPSFSTSTIACNTVTAGADSGAAPAFNGGLAGAGKTFRFTFMHAGTFAYACARHSFMRGEIRVTPTGNH